ncbi:MAG: DNA polymerase III subunit beta [Alphaproteobacteria bacterium RIFOXYD12_FULL_60_8]|nr:MAG: DNA polymerase III subunit beta [Alphaproteobacteria bacterium RIFOXYD12_FULL_60_8]
MKLTIERSDLLKTLNHVQSVVERRNTIPILSNVRLEAKAGVLRLNATDMDLEIAETAPVGVTSPGVITAPAHTLFDIARKLPEGSQVEMSYDGETGQLALNSGRSRFTLSCLPVEDFPVMASGEMPHTFTLAAGELRGLIDRTKFAISTEETRFYLNGIYLHAAVSEGVDVLRAVATDGHRLARVEVPLPSGAAGMPGVIVPRKAVQELRKLIDETGMDVQISLSPSKIRFAFDDVTLTSKLIDGTFPDYERVIPQDNNQIMEVDRKILAEAVDRVSAISTEKSRAIKMRVEKGSVELSASSPDSGSAVETLEAAYQGGMLEIGFNSRYLLDILQQIEGDAARFAMADSASPTVVREVADASAVYVLMPMRV